MMASAGIRMSIGLAVASLAVGCSSSPPLTASWYMTYPEEQAGGPSPSIPAASGEEIVVLLLNRSPRPATIHGVALNRPEAMLLDGIPATLSPGQAVIMRTGLLERAGDARHCFLPVRLFVRLKPGRARSRPVEIAGAMPTSLPEPWLKKNACSATR